MLAMQKELLETCDQGSRAWLDREVGSGTVHRSLRTRGWYLYVTQRMQMPAEDGRCVSDEYQRFLQKFTRLLPNGWQTGKI